MPDKQKRKNNKEMLHHHIISLNNLQIRYNKINYSQNVIKCCNGNHLKIKNHLKEKNCLTVKVNLIHSQISLIVD